MLLLLLTVTHGRVSGTNWRFEKPWRGASFFVSVLCIACCLQEREGLRRPSQLLCWSFPKSVACVLLSDDG